jgi:hypothetical protein
MSSGKDASIVPDISLASREVLEGFLPIGRPEPEQVLPYVKHEVDKTETPEAQEKLSEIKDKCESLILRIAETKEKIDARCSRFEVQTTETKGSQLYQAMYRVFKEKTTTVTYKHYMRALELRDQLGKEDAESLRKK